MFEKEPTSRAVFEKLISRRLKEAKLLLDKKEWDGAYYLAGYVVEFAFKICIIARLVRSDSFPDRKQLEAFYSHNLAALRREARLEEEMKKDESMIDSWETVKDWSEQSRYEVGKTKQQATELFDAIKNGVLPWIKARW